MEEKLIDRIGDEYLNGNFQDGQILLNSDVNEIVSIVKEGINANFNDIQKIQNGSHQVGNSKQLDGADLSRFSDGEMVGSDKLVPTSQQVKSYVDTKVQEIKDTTEVGKLVEDINALGVEVGNKVDKTDLVNEETTGEDKAYNCDYINELFENGVGDSLPIGTIVEYTGENIPDGFEEVIEPEDATVYVGPTEPTDGQDVWIQKSVNMLNKNAPLLVHAYPDGNNKSWIFDNNGYSFVIEIESNSEYVITKPSGANIFNISTSTSIPTSGGSATNLVDGTNNEIHIRSGANDKYLIGYFAWSGEAIDVAALLNGVQVQKGSVATEYEPYTDKKIYVKNNSGGYDEFSQAFKVEEGSWTPTIGARNEKPPTTTYDYRRGYYKKIGKMVYVEFYLEGKITALNGTNNYSTVNGLPFPVHEDNLFGQSCLHLGSYYDMLSNADTQLTLIASGSQLYVQAMHGASAGRLKTTNYFMISGSGWYMID